MDGKGGYLCGMKIVDGKLVWDLPVRLMEVRPEGKLKRVSFVGCSVKLYIDKKNDIFKLWFDKINKKAIFQFYANALPI